jgi:hypothetical protein
MTFDLRKLHRFVGHELQDVAGELERVVTESGCHLNIQDPVVNTSNIDVDHKRVNVRVNQEYIIIGYKIG